MLLSTAVPGPERNRELLPARCPAKRQVRIKGLYAATDVGGLLIDGLGDGIFLSTEIVF